MLPRQARLRCNIAYRKPLGEVLGMSLALPVAAEGTHALMLFSWRVSSNVLSQLWSMRLAISSSSARFWRATSAVSVSPALSARRSSSW